MDLRDKDTKRPLDRLMTVLPARIRNKKKEISEDTIEEEECTLTVAESEACTMSFNLSNRAEEQWGRIWTTEGKKKCERDWSLLVVFAETNVGIRVVVVIIFLRSVAAFSSSWCVFRPFFFALRRKSISAIVAGRG